MSDYKVPEAAVPPAETSESVVIRKKSYHYKSDEGLSRSPIPAHQATVTPPTDNQRGYQLNVLI